jgi:ABC-type thiamine transport system substrate-binding protein
MLRLTGTGKQASLPWILQSSKQCKITRVGTRLEDFSSISQPLSTTSAVSSKIWTAHTSRSISVSLLTIFSRDSLLTLEDQFGPFYYDSAKVPIERIPKTYLDVLDPYWKGKITLVYPNDDDGVLHLFSLIISKYGFQWLERLNQQDIQWVRGANAAATAIVDGIKNNNSSRVLTFTALSFSPEAPTFQVRQPEAPEQFMSWGQLLGIFSSTKAPESAKLFASWMVSREWQEKSASTRPTVLESLNEKSGHGITANNTQITKYVSFMQDRATVEWWRFQVESIIGLAQGKYPL